MRAFSEWVPAFAGTTAVGAFTSSTLNSYR